MQKHSLNINTLLLTSTNMEYQPLWSSSLISIVLTSKTANILFCFCVWILKQKKYPQPWPREKLNYQQRGWLVGNWTQSQRVGGQEAIKDVVTTRRLWCSGLFPLKCTLAGRRFVVQVHKIPTHWATTPKLFWCGSIRVYELITATKELQ